MFFSSVSLLFGFFIHWRHHLSEKQMQACVVVIALVACVRCTAASLPSHQLIMQQSDDCFWRRLCGGRWRLIGGLLFAQLVFCCAVVTLCPARKATARATNPPHPGRWARLEERNGIGKQSLGTCVVGLPDMEPSSPKLKGLSQRYGDPQHPSRIMNGY